MVRDDVGADDRVGSRLLHLYPEEAEVIDGNGIAGPGLELAGGRDGGAWACVESAGRGRLPAGPVIKICGLTRLEDVLLAARLGAWALGFVFAPSARRLTPAAARELIQAAKAALVDDRAGLGARSSASAPLTVGVFGDVSAEEIAGVARLVGLDAVQLHGSGSPAAGGSHAPDATAVRYALRLALPSAGEQELPLVIQAVPVVTGGEEVGDLRDAIESARRQADIVLLDSKVPGRFGGTGTAFPWPLAREAAEAGPLLVAGGIGPDNVARALEESGAWGVDVSSRVERSPGVKDPVLLAKLFEQAGTAVGVRAWAWPRACAGASAGRALPSLPGAAAGSRGADLSQEG